jgi:hypothetical protein
VLCHQDIADVDGADSAALDQQNHQLMRNNPLVLLNHQFWLALVYHKES